MLADARVKEAELMELMVKLDIEDIDQVKTELDETRKEIKHIKMLLGVRSHTYMEK
jgi:hypothetical protein